MEPLKPEEDAISGTDSEPDGDNHIEVIVVGCLLLKFGISEFLSTGLWKQFFIIKNVSNMFVNGRRGLTVVYYRGKTESFFPLFLLPL